MAVKNQIDPIVLTRSYKHSSEKLFEAFSSAASFERWIAPSDAIATKLLQHEFKVGGKYRIQFTLPDGNASYLGGEYLLIDKPTQLVFTWQWEKPDIHSDIKSLVSVTISPKYGKTELKITHENLSTIDATERHTDGWQGTIERLTTLLLNIELSLP
ncbi:MAG: SRPBCC domain-containing protein [Pseudomonadales bacterium]|nr:SRPBCC domain-containing protein [Pseudomonadales bacterium]